jgi:Protein of unknown function (DUF2934)
MLNHLTEDDIRTKAYELWEQAGCPDGGPEIYWAQAQMVLSGGDDVPAPANATTSVSSLDNRHRTS